MMYRALRFLSLVFLLSIGNGAAAQSDDFQPKGSFSFDIGVPTVPRNAAFQSLMEGLMNAGLDYRRNIFNGLTVGIGAKYSFFTLNVFAFNNNTISGGYQIPSAYLFLGYEKFTTERISFTGSLRGGPAWMISFNDSCRAKLGGPNIEQSFFLEPQVEMVMLTESFSEHAFSMVLGYSFYFNTFEKEELCIAEVSSVSSDSYEGLTRFLSIGFGYRYYFGRR